MIFTTNKPLNEWGRFYTTKICCSHPGSGSGAQTVHPPRRTLGRTRHLNLEETLPPINRTSRFL